MPTFGAREWFTRIITPSYSPWVSAARKQSAAIGNAESLIAPGKAATAEPSHDMAAFDRDHLPGRYHLDGMHSPPLAGFGVIQDRTRRRSS